MADSNKADLDGEHDEDVLTDAEREALNEDAGGDPDEDRDDDGDEGDKDDGAGAKPDDPEGKAEEQEKKEPEPESAGEDRDESFKPVPIIKADLPEGAEAALAEIKRKREAVRAQFDDGDISSTEYSEKLEELSVEAEEVRWNVRKAKLAEEAAENQRTAAWERSVEEFMTSAGAKIAQSEAALVAFDKIVRGVTGDPANARLSDRAKLEKAHAILIDDLRKMGVEAAAQPKPTPPQPAAKPKREVPPSLGKVPPAAPVDVDASKFETLNRLADADPIKFEEAFARLSPADQAEYLRS